MFSKKKQSDSTGAFFCIFQYFLLLRNFSSGRQGRNWQSKQKTTRKICITRYLFFLVKIGNEEHFSVERVQKIQKKITIEKKGWTVKSIWPIKWQCKKINHNSAGPKKERIWTRIWPNLFLIPFLFDPPFFRCTCIKNGMNKKIWTALNFKKKWRYVRVTVIFI